MRKHIYLTWVIGSLVIAPMVIGAGCGQTNNPTTTTTSSTTSTSTTTSTTTTTMYSVKGTARFYNTGGAGIQGTVYISITNETTTATATTDSTGGSYEANVPAGSYTLSATKELWSFTNGTVVVTADALTAQDVIGNPVSWEVLTYDAAAGSSFLKVVSLETTTVTGGQGAIIAVGSGTTIKRSVAPYSAWTSVTAPTDGINSVIVNVSEDGPFPQGETGLVIIDQVGKRETATDITTPAWSDAASDITLFESKNIKDYHAYNAPLGYYYLVSDGGLYKKGIDAALMDKSIAGASLNGICGVIIVPPTTAVVVGNNGAAYSVIIATDASTPISTGTTENLNAVKLGNWGGFMVSATGAILRSNVDCTSIYAEVTGIPVSLTGIFAGSTAAGSLVVGEKGLLMRHK